jgi:hypothetical protein
MPDEADVRRLALALPETYEDLHRGKPTFRVNKRIFAMMRAEGNASRADDSMFTPLDGERPVALVKLHREDQLNLAAAHPAIQPTSDYPHHGWTHVWLEDLDAATLATVIRLAWACVAPKRLSKTV